MKLYWNWLSYAASLYRDGGLCAVIGNWSSCLCRFAMPLVVAYFVATRRLLLSGLRPDSEGMSQPNRLYDDEERKNLLLTGCIHCREMSTSASAEIRHWDVEVVGFVPRPVQQQYKTEGQSIAVAGYCEPSCNCDTIEKVAMGLYSSAIVPRESLGFS